MNSYGLTHTGMRRSHNEDAIFLLDDIGLYIVADGMGGHAYGEVASALAVKTISEELFTANERSAPFSIVDAIKEANRSIYQYSRRKLESEPDHSTMVGGMGTTVAALFVQHNTAAIAHVGDSRVYRVRNSKLERLTLDHSLAAMAASKSGFPSIPIRSGFKNIITRALGIEPDVEVDLRVEEAMEYDLILLCSDGLTNMITDQRIEEILTSGQSLQSACEVLIAEANQNGGRDNISCILVRC